jgi:hypothetical protein
MIYQHAADDRDRRIADGLDAMAEEAGLSPPESATHETSSMSLTDDAASVPAEWRGLWNLIRVRLPWRDVQAAAGITPSR